jgi:ABC-type antimicrobial peptide transport system permease subunit
MKLIYQFMGEAIFLSLASMLIAMLLVACLLHGFNTLTQKDIAFPFLNGYFWLSVLVITLATGVISGSYPALFLSSFDPVKVLRGTFKMSPGSKIFRKGLVIFQFFLSVTITIGTIVVSKQVNYIQTKNLGFDRANLIYIPLEGELNAKYNTFKQEALKMPGIKDVSRINVVPTDIKSSTSSVDWEGKDPNTKISFGDAGVGYDFAKTMNMQMVAGREFSKDFATDSGGFILNEAAVSKTGYKDPVGKSFKLWDRQGIIIGVVKDFHFNSLYVPVNPFVMYLGEDEDGGKILVKTEAGKTKEALASLESLTKTLNPKYPFTYQFSDVEYNNLYRSENIVGRLANWFALLGILISCLGLLGLTIFTVERRTKEIGIRKALGASGASLFGLLSKEFLSLLIVALIIAFPVSGYFMYKWLEGFAYHTNISWTVFALAGLGSILVALLTISFQVVKAVRVDTVKGLKAD